MKVEGGVKTNHAELWFLAYGLLCFSCLHCSCCKDAVGSVLGGAQVCWAVHTSSSHSQAVVSGLQALKTRVSSLPNVKKFLQPGSQRKPPLDAKQIEEARKIFKF